MLWTSRDQADPHGVRAAFAAEAGSVADARHYTEEKLRDWGVEACLDAANLIVSELAANAVRHARSEFEVSLIWANDAIRIAVSDTSVTRPHADNPKLGATSGYGLKVVDELASDWGYNIGDHGKEVWARLAGVTPNPNPWARRLGEPLT